MPQKKIDLAKLDELIKSGKSAKEIQEFFRVSAPAIWKARKRLGLDIVNSLPPETTEKIVQGDLDLITRMKALTRVVNEQLEETQKDILNAKGTERRASQILLVKIVGEARKQIETILHIGQVWYTHQGYADFVEEVSSYLDEMSPGTKQRILEGLQKRRALRLSLQKKKEQRHESKTAK